MGNTWQDLIILSTFFTYMFIKVYYMYKTIQRQILCEKVSHINRQFAVKKILKANQQELIVNTIIIRKRKPEKRGEKKKANYLFTYRHENSCWLEFRPIHCHGR